MKVTQEHMDAYTLAATKEGELDWRERDDRAGLQAVLDMIAPGPLDAEKTAGRGSAELTQVRTVLSRADTAHARVTARQGRMVSDLLVRDPEGLLMLLALDTVREVLKPWAKVGWRARSVGTMYGPR